ncbi:hypothetical protein [Burkholderia sp. WP9]|uniref:hypothetical protein n=1 Tax=Burkholderia sp. WP9 TaxID=1500263 RepID=UPI000B85BC42|nr:hypothetical protein [Burkholderia sp. WP9]
MSKILEAIDALAHNATHPKILTAALTEIHEEFKAIKARIEGLQEVKAHAAAAEDSAAAATRAAQSASVAANQAALDAKAAVGDVLNTPAAPIVPETVGAPVVPPVTA